MWRTSRPNKQDPLSYLAACSFFRAPKLATLTFGSFLFAPCSATPAFTPHRSVAQLWKRKTVFDFILIFCPCPRRDLAVLLVLRHPTLPLSGKDLRVPGVFHIGPPVHKARYFQRHLRIPCRTLHGVGNRSAALLGLPQFDSKKSGLA